jgi:hypothetical protein
MLDLHTIRSSRGMQDVHAEILACRPMMHAMCVVVIMCCVQQHNVHRRALARALCALVAVDWRCMLHSLM